MDMTANVSLDTIPKILRRNHLSFGKQVAMRKKRFGIWQQFTWEEVFQHVTWICLGFLNLGLQKGDRVIIIGNNDPELFWIEWGVQCAGGIPICLFVDSSPEELRFFVDHSGARFIVGEDQEQIDKLLAIKESCSKVEKCIYWDEKGMSFYQEPFLLGLGKLEESGKEEEARDPDQMDQCINKTNEDDACAIVYTSGTSNLPKGVIIPYRRQIFFSRNIFPVFGLAPGAEYFSYSSPALTQEQFFGLTAGPDFPLVISFVEEPETVLNDIMEIAPHFISYLPRLWEDLAHQIRAKGEGASWWKRLLFKFALNEGYGKIEAREKNRSLSPWHKISWWLADRIILGAVRGHYGLKKVKICTIGGAASAPDLIRFFRALGVPLCNNYGITEVGMITASSPGDIRYDTVGRALPGIELKIEGEEILVRCPVMATGYWKNTEGFLKTMKGEWYCTGDVGRIEEDGNLVFFDRIEEMIRLQEGPSFSPQFIETRLRFSSYIKDAIVFGGEDKSYLTALIGIDYGTVSKWMESHNLAYTTFVELSQMSPVLNLLTEEIRKINSLLPPGNRVRKFVSLHKELDPDEAELTRTRKLKRLVIGEKYGNILGAMYENRDEVPVDAEVTYEDGRKAKLRATLKILAV